MCANISVVILRYFEFFIFYSYGSCFFFLFVCCTLSHNIDGIIAIIYICVFTVLLFEMSGYCSTLCLLTGPNTQKKRVQRELTGEKVFRCKKNVMLVLYQLKLLLFICFFLLSCILDSFDRVYFAYTCTLHTCEFTELSMHLSLFDFQFYDGFLFFILYGSFALKLSKYSCTSAMVILTIK